MPALLAVQLFGHARHSHGMRDVVDEGGALFAGLNVMPTRACLPAYRGRIDPACSPVRMRLWHEAVRTLGLQHGTSFDLDFHPIPLHGEDALVHQHSVSKRSRRHQGRLALLAQAADTRVLCAANGQLRQAEQPDERLQCIAYGEQRTGHVPHAPRMPPSTGCTNEALPA